MGIKATQRIRLTSCFIKSVGLASQAQYSLYVRASKETEWMSECQLRPPRRARKGRPCYTLLYADTTAHFNADNSTLSSIVFRRMGAQKRIFAHKYKICMDTKASIVILSTHSLSWRFILKRCTRKSVWVLSKSETIIISCFEQLLGILIMVRFEQCVVSQPLNICTKWHFNLFHNINSMFTRHSVHGFHYLLCADKSFHHSAKKDCECEKCGDKEIGAYHHLECQAKSLTLAQAAKMKK
jgi:hypothetical protein